ncbi:hypothetical protein H4R18_001851 [Coemansia javaensis]|uniref:Uncharacterized protein n=1 Tax=Coemansia javaensis TaxID=2761396 RepID=A0A9W8HK88_9FUNG|nr:hypothetical protein H4R18_001851 [Coemansia javaensis]
MVPLPAFQALPAHIIEAIFALAINSTCRRFSSNGSSAVVRLGTVFALGNTCRAWRAAILAAAFRKCSVDLVGGVFVTFQVFDADMSISPQQLRSYARHVKVLDLKVRGKGMADDFAAFHTGQMAPHGACFGSAQALNLFVHPPGDEFDWREVPAEKLHRFAMHMQECTPAVHTCNVSIRGHAFFGYYTHCGQSGSMVQALLKAEPQSHAVLDKQAAAPYPWFARDITTMSWIWHENSASAARITRACAPSLKGLAIHHRDFVGFEQLFTDDHGGPVTYASLETLSLTSDTGMDVVPVALPGNYAPFPQLASILVSMRYPFTDDVPFRGNSSTLTELGLCVNDGCMTMLAGKNMFRRLQLKYISILSAAEIVATLTKANAAHSAIQKLVMLHTQATLAETVQFLRLLPRVQMLSSRVSTFGDGFDGKSLDQIADALRSEHAPLSTCLTRWSIVNTDRQSPGTIVACAMLLSEVCPRLSTVTIESEIAPGVARALRSAAASGEHARFTRERVFTLHDMDTMSAVYIKRRLPT